MKSRATSFVLSFYCLLPSNLKVTEQEHKNYCHSCSQWISYVSAMVYSPRVIEASEECDRNPDAMYVKKDICFLGEGYKQPLAIQVH
ncbi:hypothetical protein [Myxosarcina sp. GI1(2024)]